MKIEEFVEILQKIMPNARRQHVVEYAPHIVEIFKKYQINTIRRQRHFLSQVGHESGEFRYREEIASGSRYEGRRDLGNVNPGDGRRFKGRGLIQLTGRYNYTQFDDYLKRNKELIRNPELVATDNELNVSAAGWFWMRNGLNELADRDDIVAVTRRINGGTNGLAHRRQLYQRAVRYLNELVVIDEGSSAIEEKPEPKAEIPKVEDVKLVVPKLSNIEIQRAINKGARTRLRLDGIIGPKTITALKKFQKLKGLAINGELNDATLIALSKV
jgi:predicted chitinase